jgi:hypothetical protein
MDRRVTTAVEVFFWALLLVPVSYWLLGWVMHRRGVPWGVTWDWCAVIVCGALGMLLPLLHDATDGTPLFIFAEHLGPSWATVFNGIIATVAATRLIHRARLRRTGLHQYPVTDSGR